MCVAVACLLDCRQLAIQSARSLMNILGSIHTAANRDMQQYPPAPAPVTTGSSRWMTSMYDSPLGYLQPAADTADPGAVQVSRRVTALCEWECICKHTRLGCQTPARTQQQQQHVGATPGGLSPAPTCTAACPASAT